METVSEPFSSRPQIYVPVDVARAVARRGVEYFLSMWALLVGLAEVMPGKGLTQIAERFIEGLFPVPVWAVGGFMAAIGAVHLFALWRNGLGYYWTPYVRHLGNCFYLVATLIAAAAFFSLGILGAGVLYSMLAACACWASVGTGHAVLDAAAGLVIKLMPGGHNGSSGGA